MLDYQPTIKDLPQNERPRERLQRLGSETLSTAELLAIIIQSGTRKQTAVDLAEKVLASFGGLPGLVQSGVEELMEIRGIGQARATKVLAALELGKRLAAARPDTRPRITTPRDVSNLLMQKMRFLDREHFRVLLLNVRSEVIKIKTISIGGLDSSIVHPREVFKAAIRVSAKAVILVHNHPSGDPEPSDEDLRITERLREAGDLLGVEVVDHLIIGDGRYISMREADLF